jgi:maltose alpha-D-glucosyltransferase/alpha-amylase
VKPKLEQRPKPPRPAREAARSEPLWYKDAVFYELRVGAFSDSNGDGIGDFPGLTQRLDYLRDLGVNTLWLLPFYPSPFRDDGYDISDYTNIHPDLGTLDDFKEFLREAHRRGLRVVSELVINHTSDQHPWFQRARSSPPGSRWRDFYVWSDTPERYKDARVIFHDFEPSNWTWAPTAKAYYWHRFYSHQPDLNFENPAVRKAIFAALDFWLSLGVDGLRLDAVPYLYERESTNCENLPETHAFLKELRRHVDERYRDRMLLAEANQWPEDAVGYFGDGDECHMAFHFPVMPRLFMALHMEDRFPIVDILDQTPAIPESCQWALFLRNHDELTLEMVTDEERDYMYRFYAHDAQARINLGIRRRLAPLVGNDRRRCELMNALLFSLPGTPVIYYGDEIGMGDNFYLGDRNGVRTPMQWSGDRNAGFSRANPQRLYLPVVVDPQFHYESVNVETQQNNPHSLLWWMKRLIALRKRHQAFGRGTITFLYPSNRRVLAFIRRYGDEQLLVVTNLSRFVQYVELDLSEFKGMVARELFGRTAFPPIGELPYLLTLGPHSFYWFALERPAGDEVAVRSAEEAKRPRIQVSGSWEGVFEGEAAQALALALPGLLQGRRWFGGKGLDIKSTTITEVVPFEHEAGSVRFALVRVDYTQGTPETYVWPLTFATGVAAVAVQGNTPHAVVAELDVTGRDGVQATGLLYDAMEDPTVCAALLDVVARRRQFKGSAGALVGVRTRAYRALRGPADVTLSTSLLRGEQSNTSVVYGDRLILKLFRRVADGTNPDMEVGRFLTERTRFAHVAAVAGGLEHRVGKAAPTTIAILQQFVPNSGDAWRYTREDVRRYFDRALVKHQEGVTAAISEHSTLELTAEEPPALVGEMLGSYVEFARLLGRRTAELHAALGSRDDDPAFAPEPLTPFYQRGLYQSMRNLTSQVLRILGERIRSLPPEVQADARTLAGMREKVLAAFHVVLGRPISGMRIRCHGDYHLGQVLYTGKDFVIIDFEGEPARPLSERRLKRSPLTDVAGMLRSFDYAAHAVLYETGGRQMVRPQDVPVLRPWTRFWQQWASSAFLRAYLQQAGDTPLLPRSREDLERLLDALVLEKNMYELAYELNNRPQWVRIPLTGVLGALGSKR